MTSPPIEPVRLAWLSADRSGLERRLARIGLTPGADHELRWIAGSVRLVESPDGGDRLALEPAPAAAERTGPEGPVDVALDLLAVGWGTVDLDRAAAEFPMAAFEPAAADPLIGAYARRSTGDGRLVLLEPNTEGRLSATLARWGEGPVALYLAARGPDRPFGGAVSIGAGVVSTVRDGPFGPSVLFLGGPITGPHVVVVLGVVAGYGTDPRPAGTIGA